mmetsp:Transcript_15553/g.60846  ORF Transcript_15553/g.60846 Transcript_15553/m.60846 type:complete len:246 (-) Transcript_15553:630-1367(-)
MRHPFPMRYPSRSLPRRIKRSWRPVNRCPAQRQSRTRRKTRRRSPGRGPRSRRGRPGVKSRLGSRGGWLSNKSSNQRLTTDVPRTRTTPGRPRRRIGPRERPPRCPLRTRARFQRQRSRRRRRRSLPLLLPLPLPLLLPSPRHLHPRTIRSRPRRSAPNWRPRTRPRSRRPRPPRRRLARAFEWFNALNRQRLTPRRLETRGGSRLARCSPPRTGRSWRDASRTPCTCITTPRARTPKGTPRSWR